MKIPNLNQIIKAGVFLSVCVGDMGRSFTARTFAKPPKRSAHLLTSDGKFDKLFSYIPHFRKYKDSKTDAFRRDI